MTMHFGSPASPADEAVAVTPSDTVALVAPSRWLYVGVSGDVTVDMATTGATILFKAVPAGELLPISVIRVRATGTTATQIVALY